MLAELDAPPPLLEDARLRERCFGDWEGLTWDSIEASRAEEVSRARQDPTYCIPGGGESRDELLARALTFLDELAALARAHTGTPRSRSVLLVTHSATAVAIIKHVLGLPPEAKRTFEVRNLALNEIACADVSAAPPTRWVLRTLGDCAHLEGTGDAVA